MFSPAGSVRPSSWRAWTTLLEGLDSYTRRRPRRRTPLAQKCSRSRQDEQGSAPDLAAGDRRRAEGQGPAHRRTRTASRGPKRPTSCGSTPGRSIRWRRTVGPRAGVRRHRPDPGPPRRGAGCRAGQRPARAGAGAELPGAAARGGGHPRRAAASSTGWKRKSPSSMWSGTRRWARSMCSSWARCSWRCSKACWPQRYGLDVELRPRRHFI